jgi:hypothetical protein
MEILADSSRFPSCEETRGGTRGAKPQTEDGGAGCHGDRYRLLDEDPIVRPLSVVSTLSDT